MNDTLIFDQYNAGYKPGGKWIGENGEVSVLGPHRFLWSHNVYRFNWAMDEPVNAGPSGVADTWEMAVLLAEGRDESAPVDAETIAMWADDVDIYTTPGFGGDAPS